MKEFLLELVFAVTVFGFLASAQTRGSEPLETMFPVVELPAATITVSGATGS